MDDEDLRERLRRTGSQAAPTPLSSTEVDRLLEDTMTDHPSGSQPERTSRPRWPMVAAVAASVVLLGIGVALRVGGDDDPAPVATEQQTSAAPSASAEPELTDPGSVPVESTELTAPPGVASRCAVPTAEILANATEAFDGVVIRVDAETVELRPSKAYAGEITKYVDITAPPPAMSALIGAVDFQVGERYLVSAVDGQVTVCGFSGPYSADLEQLYAEAFGA